MSTKIYPDMEDFYRDLGLAYRGSVQAFAVAGCGYLHCGFLERSVPPAPFSEENRAIWEYNIRVSGNVRRTAMGASR